MQNLSSSFLIGNSAPVSEQRKYILLASFRKARCERVRNSGVRRDVANPEMCRSTSKVSAETTVKEQNWRKRSGSPLAPVGECGRLTAQPGKRWTSSTVVTSVVFLRIFWPAHLLRLWIALRACVGTSSHGVAALRDGSETLASRWEIYSLRFASLEEGIVILGGRSGVWKKRQWARTTWTETKCDDDHEAVSYVLSRMLIQALTLRRRCWGSSPTPRMSTSIIPARFRAANLGGINQYTIAFISRPFSGQRYPTMREQLQEEDSTTKKGPTPKLRGHPRDAPNVRISKSLSWLLRHGAEKAGLNIRRDGYAKVSDVVSPKYVAR